MEMKAVILAAGKGVRMLPLTETKPKVMVELKGKPLLQHVLEPLVKVGIEESIIVVGYKKEKIIEFFGSEFQGMKLTYVEQKEPKGTADAVTYAKDFVGKENFLLVPGDNLYSVDDLRDTWREDDFLYIKSFSVENPERYGVLIEKNSLLTEIKEKPKEFVGNQINTGLYKMTPEIFEAIKLIDFSPRGELELTDALSLLAKKSKVRVLKIKDYWKDLGLPEDIPKMEKFLLRL